VFYYFDHGIQSEACGTAVVSHVFFGWIICILVSHLAADKDRLFGTIKIYQNTKVTMTH
jgi:hypothetical protein